MRRECSILDRVRMRILIRNIGENTELELNYGPGMRCTPINVRLRDGENFLSGLAVNINI
jgi:hypothetical protein